MKLKYKSLQPDVLTEVYLVCKWEIMKEKGVHIFSIVEIGTMSVVEQEIRKCFFESLFLPLNRLLDYET